MTRVKKKKKKKKKKKIKKKKHHKKTETLFFYVFCFRYRLYLSSLKLMLSAVGRARLDPVSSDLFFSSYNPVDNPLKYNQKYYDCKSWSL